MPAPSPPPRPQTIKQAKAAFKNRGRPSLSDREKRQLERAVELDQRAWRAREAEKRKAEAANKRAEKEKREKEERGRVRMGSQRRCDRFGYKSSQMHLGAFLNKKPAIVAMQKENLTDDSEDEDEDFGEGEMDDITLLAALKGTEEAPDATIIQPAHTIRPDTRIALQHHCPSKHHSHNTASAILSPYELQSFWDELDSSTQVARELDTAESHTDESKATLKARSFTSDDFDLTAEDLEELSYSNVLQEKQDVEKKLMPPPPLPARHPVLPNHGFTMGELESYVEDDLQLT